jgi:hypothetical protein
MSNRTPTIATKMRYFAGSFWTPDTDTRLQRLEAQGLSAAKIAAKLGVSRNSVIARSQRLRGLSRTFPSYAERFVTVVQKHHRRRDSVVSCLPAFKGCRICDEGRVAQCSHQCSRIHQLWRSFFLYLPSPCSVWRLFQT